VAITLVGTFEGQKTDGTAVTVNLSGTASGDVVYTFQHTSVGSGSEPSGYTLLASNNDGVDSTFYVSRKVLSGADASVVFPAGVNLDGNACAVIVLRGVDNTTPEDTATTLTTGTGAADSPSITTVTNGAWVISAFGGNFAVDPITCPTGYGNQVDITSSASTQVTVGAATKLKSPAGAENPGPWVDYFGAFVAVSIAVRPDAPTVNIPAVLPNYLNIAVQTRMVGY